jgi:peptide/nickel transport system substrate-binding protein
MLTSWVSADVLNPVSTSFVNASCDKANFGWPCDEQLEKLRDDFARETDPGKQKAIATSVQARVVSEYPTHVFLGQWYQPVALRSNITGMLESPAVVLWNIEKK